MAQGDGALGRVDWSVCETVSHRALGQWVLKIEAEDIVVDEHQSSDYVLYYRKRMRLDGPFQFGIDEHPGRNEKEMKGFALTAIHNDVQTTS